MPSPTFIAKAFIAGFLSGHLVIPAEKSWLLKLARSPAFDPPRVPTVPDLNATSPQPVQDAGPLRYLVGDNTPVLLHPSLGNLSASSTLTPGRQSVPTDAPVNSQPSLSPETPGLVLHNNSDPVLHRPSATQATFSTTLYYVYGLPSASARPPIPVVPSYHDTGHGSSVQFGLTFRSLLCIFILLYYLISVIYRKRMPKCKTRKLPERVVSTIIANLQGDPGSLKASSLVSRSWTKESHRHLFHTISLNSRQSADLWFSSDTLGLANHVRSIHLSMEALTGAEGGLSRFPRIKRLRISGWRGSQHSSPAGWAPLDRTVGHLELLQPEGTMHEILTFVSFFTSLESLLITRSRQQSRCEIRVTHAADPEVVSIRFRMLRHPTADRVGLMRPCPGNGMSVWLRQSSRLPLVLMFLC